MSLKDRAKIGNLVGVLNEIFEKVGHAPYELHAWQNRDELFKKTVEPKLLTLAKYKGNKEWLMGFLTLADFMAAELSYYIEKIYPNEYQKHPFLQQIREAFNNLNEIKIYYEQEWAIKGPFTFKGMSQIDF